MRAVLSAFRQVVRSIRADYMMLACAAVPILMGVLFRFGIPALETLLCAELEEAQVLTPYYGLIDLFLAAMTALMLSFSGVMVILEELDNGTAHYLVVTPLGRGGYLVSRIGILMLLSILYSVALLCTFTVSGMALSVMLCCALISGGQGVVNALLVAALAKNKVEGMALIKMAGLMLLGLFVPSFISGPAAYIAGVLPTFWMALLAKTGAAVYVLPACIMPFFWTWLFYVKFRKKLI